MRWVLACAAVFGILCQPDRGRATEPAEGVGKCPIARLQSLGFPVKCTRFEHPTDVTDPNEVEYIGLGKVDSRSAEPPSLPEEAFDIFPEFPKLRKIHLEYFLVDSENLKRLKEVRHLKEFSIHISRGAERKSFAKPEDLDFLAELPGLERLGLTSSDLTDDMIVKLLPLVSLQRLHLSWNYKLTHAIIPILEQLPALEWLEMNYTAFAPAPIEARRFAARLRVFRYPLSAARDHVFSLEDFREIVTLPRHTWQYAHRTTVPLADIVALLPDPITRVRFSGSSRNGLDLHGVDEQGEKFCFSMSRPLTDSDLQGIGQMDQLISLSIEVPSEFGGKVAFTAEGLAQLTHLGKLEFLRIAAPFPLTGDSLAALARMPSLRHVELRAPDFSVNPLAWVRSTPQLERLVLLGGSIRDDALGELAHARKLQTLTLGQIESPYPDYSVSISAPARQFTVESITRLTLASSRLTVDEVRIVARFPSLESLTLEGPITDAHLESITRLAQLSRLTVMANRQQGGRGPVLPVGRITERGIEQLRNLPRPLYLQVRTSGHGTLEAMADQFGWRFYGCSSGCCDTLPRGGAEWTIEAGRLVSIQDAQLDHLLGSDDKTIRAVRMRGPRRLGRLVLDRSDLPPTADTLCLTDLHIGEIVFQGWLPESIRIWGDSRVGRIAVSDVPNDARTSLRYYFLQNVKELTVPAFARLSHIRVVECSSLNAVRLDGFYPHLEQLELRGVDQLQYLSAPHRGDAPRLEYPADSHWGTNLPSLRLLKVPGTAIGGTPVIPQKRPGSREARALPRFPPNLVEADLRATPIDDEWLAHLAALPHLKIVRIGACEGLTDKAKAAFRQRRPNVHLDEETVHQPGR